MKKMDLDVNSMLMATTILAIFPKIKSMERAPSFGLVSTKNQRTKISNNFNNIMENGGVDSPTERVNISRQMVIYS